MLVSMKRLLEKAQKQGYAVAAANVFTDRTVEACFKAAHESKSPVIIACTAYVPMEELAVIARFYERKYPEIPVALHLDHGKEVGTAVKAIQYGFTSVMLDKSTKPYEENVLEVKKLVQIAHAAGVSVEAELGHVGQGAEYDKTRDSGLTRKDEAMRFVKETKVDCLAVAVGTSHGVYKGEPHLDFDLLQELSQTVPVPLVLHGGSNTGDEQLKETIRRGIQKINLSTDLSSAYIKGVNQYKNAQPPLFNEDGDLMFKGNRTVYANQALEAGAEAYKSMLKHYMKVFGSEGKAWKYEEMESSG